MGVNLVRKNSETPNIHNYDDTRIMRYAVGEKGGIVKGYGNQLALESVGRNITIKSGEIIYQGWQVEIDGEGVRFTIDTNSGTLYYLIYLEINLTVPSNQQAELKMIKNSFQTPTIEAGDDLTTVKDGVARVPIYTFEAVNSELTKKAERKLPILEYNTERITELQQLLTLLNGAVTQLKNDLKDGKFEVKQALNAYESNLVRGELVLNLEQYMNPDNTINVTLERGCSYIISFAGETYVIHIDNIYNRSVSNTNRIEYPLGRDSTGLFGYFWYNASKKKLGYSAYEYYVEFGGPAPTPGNKYMLKQNEITILPNELRGTLMIIKINKTRG